MGVITTTAPGKLFIAGEYAVVTPGEPAILIAVNRFITVTLTETHTPKSREHSPHVTAAIRAVEELCAERNITQQPFEVNIHSELESPDGRKYGLGSSGAVTVALVSALDQLYKLSLSQFERFQIALLSILDISPSASGGDVAASTYGGWLLYHSPDRTSLKLIREQEGITAAMNASEWDVCVLQSLEAPQNMKVLVGWVGQPAATHELVDHMRNQDEIQRFTEKELLPRNRNIISELQNLLPEWSKECDVEIRKARTLLNELAQVAKIPLETAELRTLCDIAERYGASAKTSGAGGGDCAIAFASKDVNIAAILRDWKSRNFTDLQLAVHTFTGDRHGR